MKRSFRNIIAMYFLFILVILFFYFSSSRVSYNSLKVIDNIYSSKKTFDTKLPKKIVVHSEYLGDTIIENNVIMNDILRYLSEITSSKASNENMIKDNNVFNKDKVIKAENVVNLSVDIYYLNDSRESFKINNSLILDKKQYQNNSHIINTLRNTLFSCLYNYPNIVNIMENDKAHITYKANDYEYTLDESQKSRLISSLRRFRTMEDNKDFLDINLNEKPIGVFNVFIDRNDDKTSNNRIYIAVYKEYLVVQYLGDENGKNIYIKGELNEKYFK